MRTILIILLTILLSTFFSNCKRKSEGAYVRGKHISNTVCASVETANMPQKKKDDSADDPAIWINKEDPEKSLIIGTDKKGGLGVYNLAGEELSYLEVGRMNNADIRYDIAFNGEKVDILGASNRTTHSIDFFAIHPEGTLTRLNQHVLKSSIKDEVYGFCLYKSHSDGSLYAYVNSKAGEIEQWAINLTGSDLTGEIRRSFTLPGQVEGMVADDSFGIVYIGEEEGGIWKYPAEALADTIGVKLENTSEDNNENIAYDIEGLAIYAPTDTTGYLIASSQGNYSYAIYDRMNNNYITSFRIVDGDLIDGVEETDGLEVTTVALGSKFPKGILVVQDGFNYDDGKYVPQNFKIIDWRAVEKIIN